jgi:elongation factor G
VVGANYAATLHQIRERLSGMPLPVVIPIGAGSIKETQTPFVGVIDVIAMKALYFDAGDHGRTIRTADIPAENLEEAKKYREELFDVLTRNDEKDLVTSAYLEGTDVPADTVRALIREQAIKRLVQPVLCGSGREHAGIQPLLDAICHYLPSPLDRPPVVGINPKKEKEEKRKPDFKDPFCGLVFKVIAQDSGDLFYIRTYSGLLKNNARVYNPGKDVKENIGKLYHIHADPTQRDELPETYAGDIVAVIGLKDSVTGDTLCETQHPILLEPITFAETVVSQQIEPESSADKDKLANVLNKLQREDPTFVVKTDKDTGQMLMSGMGTLHLEVKRHRMERDFRLKIRVRPPQVSYRETIRNKVTVTGECDRMIGGKNVFARVKVEFVPRKAEQPVSVTNKLKPNDLPAPFPDVIVRGLKSALQSGGLGFPVLNVHATVVDADFDPERSTEPAFEAAAADAVMKAFSRENMQLLEPMMKLTVTVPSESSGNVFSYLMAHRGEVDRQDSDGRLFVIEARVPLVNMFDYADDLRSLTAGRASSTLEPHSYAPAPDEVLRSFLEG